MKDFWHPELFNEFIEHTNDARAFNPVLRYKKTDDLGFKEVLNTIGNWHKHEQLKAQQRGESRRSTQKKVIEKQETVLESLLANFLFNESKPLTVSLSKRILDIKDRYRPRWLTYSILTKTLKILSSPDIDIVKITKGETVNITEVLWDEARIKESLKSVPTIVELTERGKTFITEMSLDNLYTEHVETIHLREKKKNGNRVNLQYEDTDKTMNMRTQMTVINNYLKELVIEHYDLGRLPQNSLYRVFYDDFNKHGRLYGGAWYQLKKKNRLDMSVRREVDTSLEQVIELDFKACGLSIIYNISGRPVDPNIDPYQAGSLSKYPRNAIKDLINAFLNNPTMRRFPKGFKERFNKGRKVYEDLPQSDISLGTVLNDIFEVHPILKNTNSPIDTSITDSDIVIKVMLKSIDEGLRVFPLHDAFFFAESDADRLESIVNQVTTEVTGFPIRYELKKYDVLSDKEITI